MISELSVLYRICSDRAKISDTAERIVFGVIAAKCCIVKCKINAHILVLITALCHHLRPPWEWLSWLAVCFAELLPPCVDSLAWFQSPSTSIQLWSYPTFIFYWLLTELKTVGQLLLLLHSHSRESLFVASWRLLRVVIAFNIGA